MLTPPSLSSLSLSLSVFPSQKVGFEVRNEADTMVEAIEGSHRFPFSLFESRRIKQTQRMACEIARRCRRADEGSGGLGDTRLEEEWREREWKVRPKAEEGKNERGKERKKEGKNSC